MSNRKEEMPEAAAEALKVAMKYTDAQNRCKTCGAFGTDEHFDGGHNDRPARCEFNGYWFEVDKGGYCRHWHEPEKADGKDERGRENMPL